MPHSGVPQALQLLRTNFHDTQIRWSQANPHRFDDISELASSNDVAVVVSRHPFSVVHRFRQTTNEPFGMDCGNKTAGPGFMARACKYRAPEAKWVASLGGAIEIPHKATCNSKSTRKCWPSLGEAWSTYFAGYKDIAHRFRKVITVRYEDMLEDPKIFIRDVAHAADLDMPTQVESPIGLFSDASPDLTSVDYGAKYTCAELATLCQRLDKEVLYELGYHGCQKSWDGYRELVYNRDRYEGMEDPASYLRTTVPESHDCIVPKSS